MKVLLTGGAGYIGSHTAVELLGSGHEVVVVDDFSNSAPEAIKRVQELTGCEFPFYDLNVCDRAALDRVFDEHAIDVAIHFAGFKAVGESVVMPIEYYRNNLDSTLSLIESMRAHGVFKLVFSSSATVYGVNETEEMVEGMPTGASNPYGWTKFMIEQILRDLAYADKRWSIALLRYFNPVGAHESGRIGEDPGGIPNNLMPRVMQNAQGKIEVLGVFGDDYDTPDGSCVRDYIHVVDLAKGHVAALKYLEDHPGTEEINLGTGVGYSVLDIIRTFERVNGLKLNYRVEARRPGDLPACYANPEKAKRLLGWQAEKTLEDMCRDAWHWQTLNPDGYRK